MSVPEFGAAIGLYTKEFMSSENFLQLHRHINHSPSRCWTDLIASQTPYNTSCSKAASLSSALRYIHALLTHTLWDEERALESMTSRTSLMMFLPIKRIQLSHHLRVIDLFILLLTPDKYPTRTSLVSVSTVLRGSTVLMQHYG
ncbi:hypothetical protein PVK06_028261 [Gossypium arboreum]|uniref:Uncharacterized protein n=1 Tax=Gossypium arboreum TaxID=29729 RepID=A0ABR0P3S8_GOSAR|nr:hypothetical protein PVK06_028261 [Gossypium arboreum]